MTAAWRLITTSFQLFYICATNDETTAVVFTLLSAYTNHGARPSNTAVGFRSQLAEETRYDSAGGGRAKGGTRNAVPAAKRRKNGMQYPTSSARIASQILPQKKLQSKRCRAALL